MGRKRDLRLTLQQTVSNDSKPVLQQHRVRNNIDDSKS